MARPTRCNSQDELADLLLSLQELDLSESVSYRTNYMQAHGGFCDVFMGHSLKHGGLCVAVKRLRVHILQNKDVSKMIFRELKIWSTLNHPNVLPLLGFVMHDKYPCSVSKWMVNGTVRKCLDSSSELNVLEMARGIAAGLLYLHGESVIHSDLKCDNVFVSDEGIPLLADFGISRLMSASTTLTFGSSCTAGSARWMAKELLMVDWDDPNSGKHSKATDVWAFGMVLYELLTGDLPYPDLRNDLQVSMAIINGQFPRKPLKFHNDNYLQILWYICETCWAITPFNRPEMVDIYNLLHADSLIQEFAPTHPTASGQNTFAIDAYPPTTTFILDSLSTSSNISFNITGTQRSCTDRQVPMAADDFSATFWSDNVEDTKEKNKETIGHPQRCFGEIRRGTKKTKSDLVARSAKLENYRYREVIRIQKAKISLLEAKLNTQRKPIRRAMLYSYDQHERDCTKGH